MAANFVSILKVAFALIMHNIKQINYNVIL
jgi:hypothetical protein